MTDQHLLRAITDNPDDDLPRLAYADWCEENGNPLRAEFIRLGFELAATGLTDCPAKVKAGMLIGYPVVVTRCGKCDFCRPMGRLKDLLDSKPPIPGLWPGFSCAASVEVPPEKSFSYDTLFKSTPRASCYFRKGFVEEIHLPLNVWIGRLSDGSLWGERTVNSHPIRRVVACDKEPHTIGSQMVAPPATWHQGVGGQHGLPSAIFNLLPVTITDVARHTNVRGVFPERQLAHDALSDVLLRVAHDPELLLSEAEKVNRERFRNFSMGRTSGPVMLPPSALVRPLDDS